jgi:hypothetical protein
MRQTVAVVEAYDDPNAESDLAAYRSNYGLPACTTADGCFRKVNQVGSTASLPTAGAPWAVEISADLDMISAICPNCHILLVEGNSDAITDMGTAVNEAVKLGAKIVDVGWAMPESAADTGYDKTYFSHPGVAIVAPAPQAAPGSSGAGLVGYPASSPDVTAVGATTLTPGTSGRGWSETSWPETGSGCSADEPEPSWQATLPPYEASGCGNLRSVNDVSADGDPANSPVATYDTYSDSSYQASGWAATGGTGTAAAIIAGAYALAGTPTSGTYPTSYPYSHPSLHIDGPVDVDPCINVPPPFIPLGGQTRCGIRPVYSPPTGLGSPSFTFAFSDNGSLIGALSSAVLGKCLDDTANGTTNGTKIAVRTCNGGPSQKWTIEPDSTVRINGSCMDAAGSGTTAGTAIQLWSCTTNSTSEQWVVESDAELINEASGLCLDDPANSATDGTQLKLASCDASAGEQWTQPYSVPSSTGQVVSRVSANLCLDDYENSTADANKVDIYTCTGGTAQKWTIEANGTLEVNGRCLDVSHSGTAAGTGIDIYNCNGTGAQQWRTLSDGSLLSPESGKCLSDPGGSTTNTTQMLLGTCAGTSGQEWTLP